MSWRALQDARRDAGALSQAVAWPTARVAASDGVLVTTVTTPPVDLARAAGTSLEAFSLGTCIAAEGYGDRKNDPEGHEKGVTAATIAMAQVVVNEARARRSSITKLLTTGIASKMAPAGFYGEQRGRYAATTRPPTRWHLEVAEQVLAGDVPNLARGALHFLAPSVWARGGTQSGRKLRPLPDVLGDWMLGSERNDWVGQVPTVDPFYLVFLGPGGTSSSRATNRARILDIMAAGPQGPAPGDPDAGAWPDLAGSVLALAAMGLGAYLIVETFA